MFCNGADFSNYQSREYKYLVNFCLPSSLTNVFWFACRHTSSEAYRALEFSYVQGTSDISLRGITVGNLLQQQTEKTPDREAYIFCSTGLRKTFSQLLDEVCLFVSLPCCDREAVSNVLAFQFNGKGFDPPLFRSFRWSAVSPVPPIAHMHSFNFND